MLADAALERLNDPRLNAVVAMEAGRPVGRGSLFDVGDIGRIVDVCVMPDARRRGVGLAVVAHLIALAGRFGVRVVCLQVDAANDGAVSFFERCGFAQEARISEFDAAT
jgi:ribosomal-protein-alanine N-acetyltransferase